MTRRVRAGSKELIREINAVIVLNAIRYHGLLSRTEIAKRTGLSLPTVSTITADLIAAGLVSERDTGISTGGRPPTLLALHAAAGHALGVKLTERAVIGVLVDLEASVVERHTLAIADASPDGVVDTIARVAGRLTSSAAGRPIFGIGVGAAGVIDRTQGFIHHATHLNWRNVSLGSRLEAALDMPVVVDNDVNALVAMEQWFGAGRGASNLMVVTLGRGVGLGMVLDGKLYRGARGGAGEFGHVKVQEGGPRCACGSEGCLESLIADPALERRFIEITGEALTVVEAAERARSEETVLAGIFSAAGAYLGSALADLVNILNPEVIVVSGEGVHASDLFFPSMIEALESRSFDGLYDDVKLVVEEWDDEAWARGAASLVLGELFQPTLHQQESTVPSLKSAAT